MEGNGSTPPAPLMCPILTGAMTTAVNIMQKMDTNRQSATIIDPMHKAALSAPPQVAGIPCMKEKCAFWHVGFGACGIAAAPEILNLIGGMLNEQKQPNT